jgi:hypothetical protein
MGSALDVTTKPPVEPLGPRGADKRRACHSLAPAIYIYKTLNSVRWWLAKGWACIAADGRMCGLQRHQLERYCHAC